MYRPKARSRGKPLERIHLPERIRLETDLRGAAGRGELTVHYQPQFDAETGTIVGAEALVRWQHPELGLLTPVAFIDIAEESDLIEEVGEFVLVSACSFGAQLRREGHAIKMSVNVSANQLTNPRFEPFIGATLGNTDFPGDALTLEITESRVISEAVIHNGALENIRKLGVGLSVDDFGTGYSSLYQLRHLPVTEVKIDRSFISSLSDEGSLAFIAGIVSLGHGLGLRVVAEGVERPGQLTVLRGTGCDRLQGYYLGRPVEELEFRGLLATSPSHGQTGWPFADGRHSS
nr:EAL domain-containing protein [Arthrobacter sp. 147(2020)]